MAVIIRKRPTASWMPRRFVRPAVVGLVVVVSVYWLAVTHQPLVRQRDHTTTEDDTQLLANVTDFVKKNGGYVNEKVEIRTINGVLTGIFAKQPLEPGEIAWHIPAQLILRTKNYDYCEAIGRLRHLLRQGQQHTTGNLNPYERYLATRTEAHHFLPFLWSPSGQALLTQLVGTHLKDYDFANKVKDWWETCDNKKKEFATAALANKDSTVRTALVILKVRQEALYMDLVPFHDIINHQRDEGYNVEPQYTKATTQTTETATTRKDYERKKTKNTPNRVPNAVAPGEVGDPGMMVLARRPIQIGEQLTYSYAECQDCGRSAFAYDTTSLFINYGFVESLPQYWELSNFFDGRRQGNESLTRKLAPVLRFKVYRDSNNTSISHKDLPDNNNDNNDNVKVQFIQLPSSEPDRVVRVLQKEIERLKAFAKEHFNDPAPPPIPAREHASLSEFYGAFQRALTVASRQLSHLDADVYRKMCIELCRPAVVRPSKVSIGTTVGSHGSIHPLGDGGSRREAQQRWGSK